MYELQITIDGRPHSVQCQGLIFARALWDFIHAQETKPQSQKLHVDSYVTNAQVRP